MFHLMRVLGAGAGHPAASGQYNAVTAGQSTSVTFTGVSIGTADPTRVVAVTLYTFASAATVTGVTIGGITATKAIGVVNGTTAASSIWYAAVPTGTTASVVVTASGTIFTVLGSYSMYNLTSNTPFSTGSAASGATVSISTPASGFLIASSAILTTAPTGSGLTMDFDTNIGGGCCGNQFCTGGHLSTTSGTPTVGFSVAGALAVATWH